jgi:hypothetical protein
MTRDDVSVRECLDGPAGAGVRSDRLHLSSRVMKISVKKVKGAENQG